MKEDQQAELRPEKLFWALFRRKVLKQISGLHFEQAQFIVSLIPPKEHGDWMAWHEGLDEWKKLSRFKILTESPQGEPVYVPPLPPPHDDTAKDPKIDMRLSSRFLKEFKVDIVSPLGKPFSSVTVNVSASGMLLSSSVPPELGWNFSCRLSRENGDVLDIFCSLIKHDNNDRNRVKFVEISRPKVLLSWLVDPKTK